MKRIIIILLFVAGRLFAEEDSNYMFLPGEMVECGPTIDKTNILVAGNWSKPVTTKDGTTIRGRLLLFDTAHYHVVPARLFTFINLALQLQECSSKRRLVMLLFDVDYPANGLRCELHDDAGVLVSGSYRPVFKDLRRIDGSTWEWQSLGPRRSRSLSLDVQSIFNPEKTNLQFTLINGQGWAVPPGKGSAYYLSGTFTAIAPTNQPTLHQDVPQPVFAWYGTLKLPPVKIPSHYGFDTLPPIPTNSMKKP